jgi:hypothetical protein
MIATPLIIPNGIKKVIGLKHPIIEIFHVQNHVKTSMGLMEKSRAFFCMI